MVVDLKALLMNRATAESGLAHCVCAFGLDLVDNSYFPWAAIRIRILAEILLGHLIYVRIGAVLGDIRNAPAKRQVTVRIVRIHKVQSNARIPPHIPVFDSPFSGIDEDVLAIIVDPDRRHLRSSVRHDCRELCKRFLLE